MEKNINFQNIIHGSTNIIFKAMKKFGGEARLVGGCVRDSMLSIAPKDIDFAVNLEPSEIREACKKSGIIAISNNGIRFGTVIALIDDKNVEITSLRNDIKCYGRAADVAFTKNWQDDASRRDFTFNALYLDEQGNLYDYFNGLLDLQHGILRFIGDPDQRITEDYLRLLRVFRFYARFGQGELSLEIQKACQRHAKNIEMLSGERIWQEIKALFEVPIIPLVRSLEIMKDSNIISYVFPTIDLEKFDQSKEILKSAPLDPIIRLALFIKVTACDPLAISNRWRIRKSLEKTIITLCAIDIDELAEKNKKYLALYGPSLYDMAVNIGVAMGRIKYENLDQETTPLEFPVTNSDLIALGMQGREIGQKRKELYDLWIESNCQLSREMLLSSIQPKDFNL